MWILMAQNGGKGNFISVKKFIPECSLNHRIKIPRSLSNIGSITAITFIFIDNVRLQGIWSLNLKKD